ncbi:MAG: CRISPR-associated helicase Cas3', partial [Fibrobacter sp.]|nr:CRISPR-associated helicase Cas3' [Fibrobacter sp.]
MLKSEYYAHTIEGQPLSTWQKLEDHLFQTARLAGQFAGEFGCKEWGYTAGLWHDIGKYSHEFQQYVRKTNDPDAHIEESTPGKVDHSTAGALWSIHQFQDIGRIFAYLLAGHHAGLLNYETDVPGKSSLSLRLSRQELFDAIPWLDIPEEIIHQSKPTERPPCHANPAFWIRLLFSCVVDADFLDTEAFYNPEKSANRKQFRSISELMPQFTKYMQQKSIAAIRSNVNDIRAEVLAQCIQAASKPTGKFSLTVPTGGGKTLSSLAFALHHSVKHGKKRIIYVIPYTSIIEQTAEQFRTIFGDDVIEHHSNLDVSDASKDTARSRLACENWDAPVIVTTSVQFFESLFASRTSRCRKLHNIVNSVVILDEAQLLPSEFLEPILSVLNELESHYGVTILLSTATQPALSPQKTLDFDFQGLPGIQEIIPDKADLYVRLNRVTVTIPHNLNEPVSWDSLVHELTTHESVLCIVNRRDDCRELWSKMPAGTYHLSALMCGSHRSQTIKEIKDRLKRKIPTRVISTQLVEAGVDIDFPVVYRAMAGLDSIAQAAGRCNREGTLPKKGKVIIFIPPTDTPPGILRQAAQIGKELIQSNPEDILSPEQYTSFFRRLYWMQGNRLD